MLHWGWFLGCQLQSWNERWSGKGGTEWTGPELLVDAGRAIERVGFDCMIIEDASFVPDIYGGSAEWTLANGFMSPKHDPLPYVPLIGAATSRIGIIPTVTTSFYPPFLAARLLATIDHLTNGRMGANLVMSHNDRTAQNYGFEAQADHDLRYEIGTEWVELVFKLWGSWERDALVMDEERGIYVDHTKVHRVDFEGNYYKSRGPLNILPSPQGRPVICQAGGSGPGRNFAARFADVIICNVVGVAAMKEFRQDLSVRLQKFGRKPTDCKVLYLVSPVIGDTARQASERALRSEQATESNINRNLASMSYYSGVDFHQFDLDGPMPQVSTNASRSTVKNTWSQTQGKTLREFAAAPSRGSYSFVGTFDAVAAEMGEVMEEVGGDGYLIAGQVTRRNLSEVTDGLAPALRRRGLLRDNYTYELFHDNLMEF
jgi:FMN-dependent oxidoreductase (nitrilotriacetate monooxygenase family)